MAGESVYKGFCRVYKKETEPAVSPITFHTSPFVTHPAGSTFTATVSLQARVMGPVHFAHPASAQKSDHLVVAERLPDQRCGSIFSHRWLVAIGPSTPQASWLRLDHSADRTVNFSQPEVKF